MGLIGEGASFNHGFVAREIPDQGLRGGIPEPQCRSGGGKPYSESRCDIPGFRFRHAYRSIRAVGGLRDG